MAKSLWTILMVAALGLLTITQVAALIGFAGDADPVGPAAHIFAIFFFVTLAAVAWLETPSGALLVVIMGLAFFAAELVSAALNLYPEYGPQIGQVLFALPFLAVPILGLLSYRRLTR